MRMRQETFKKSYYIPAFGKSIEIRRNQDIDEEGILGKELLALYGEDCILEGETKSLMEKVASGEIGGSSLTTEQTAAISKINGLEVSASEINEGTKSLYFKRGQIIEPFTTSNGITVIDTLASVQFQVLNESTPCGDTCLEIKTTVAGKHLMFEKAITPISLVQAKTLSFYVATDNPANFGNAAIGLAYSKK